MLVGAPGKGENTTSDVQGSGLRASPGGLLHVILRTTLGSVPSPGLHP